jgi:transcriptional regulator with XRE-family HTH domain
MGLGKNIAGVREALDLSQDELGAAVGVTGKAVSQWELDKTVPDARKLPLIAKALHTTVGRLFDEEPGLSREEREILDMLRTVMPGDKGRYLDVLRAFMRKSPK